LGSKNRPKSAATAPLRDRRLKRTTPQNETSHKDDNLDSVCAVLWQETAAGPIPLTVNGHLLTTENLDQQNHRVIFQRIVSTKVQCSKLK
jgi:hypothetical protein